jgi:CDP-glucose 4,6-dehydratase
MGRSDLEPIILNRASAEIRDQYLDSTRASERLGWRPRFSLEQGLKATLAWYTEYLAGQPV